MDSINISSSKSRLKSCEINSKRQLQSTDDSVCQEYGLKNDKFDLKNMDSVVVGLSEQPYKKVVALNRAKIEERINNIKIELEEINFKDLSSLFKKFTKEVFVELENYESFRHLEAEKEFTILKYFFIKVSDVIRQNVASEFDLQDKDIHVIQKYFLNFSEMTTIIKAVKLSLKQCHVVD